MEFERNIDYIPDDQHGSSTYFIYNVNDKLTKIGITANNVKWRFKDIKAMNPNITLLFTINRSDYESLERALHKHFQKKHYHGEWFNLDKDDFLYVLRKFKDHIKRYKINNLLIELGATEKDIDNLDYVIQPPDKIKHEWPKEDKKKKSVYCERCNKVLKIHEEIHCRICLKDIQSEKRFREQRLQMANSAKNYIRKNNLAV